VEEIESDDKDAENDSKTSLRQVWAIDAKTKIKSEEDSNSNPKLHPITIMSFPDRSI
jgi:hypothetical protein